MVVLITTVSIIAAMVVSMDQVAARQAHRHLLLSEAAAAEDN
jgi:hypothetical protein